MSAPESHSTGISGPANGASLEQSGTLSNEESGLVPNSVTPTPEETIDIQQESQKSEGEEQPLEWHEVIELQAFSDRKVWIEEKTKLLEQMPPIEVFAGLDAVRESALEVPGLPTRKELEEWIAEHDRIEKETEIFDSGELKKLKMFTKAAAHRNLSPADTDLIELTLTTIYALDKLLHLLRDRSEHLDLLSIRLTWEERRIAAWVELNSTIKDITEFLRSRGRWSPAVYDDLEAAGKEEDPPPTPPLTSSNRRNSVVSIASIASDTSSASLSLSRGARFKLSEQLSRDAAQFASRVSSLRHSKINAAGKALDKLIDDSRKPVPEVLLDEQDKLENNGINEMEDVGKFVMSVVMQWKKADELFVETVKDKSTALELVDELETASFSHPNSRQDAAYLSRTNALTKRLAYRGNPAGTSSNFPRPMHPLFPDQPSITDSIVQLLSSEYLIAIEHAKKAETLSRQYHAGLDAVKKIESMCKSAAELVAQLSSCICRLRDGVGNDNGDGTPPDLSSELCLSSTQHAAFLALLPSILQDSQQAESAALALLDSSNAAFVDLDRPGVDLLFVTDSRAQINDLRLHLQDLEQVRAPVLARVTTLNDLRRWWIDMEAVFKGLCQIRYELNDAIQRDAWKQRFAQNDALPTPEGSPASHTLPFTAATDLPARIDAVSARFDRDNSIFLRLQTSQLGHLLHAYTTKCKDGLSDLVVDTRRLQHMLEAVSRQATSMHAVQSEVNDLQAQLEDLEIKFDGHTEDVLEGSLQGKQVSIVESELQIRLEQLKVRVTAFSESLTRRVPFVADSNFSTNRQSSAKVRPPALGFGLDTVLLEASLSLPIDLAEVDRAVRLDANSFSLALSGSLESVTQKAERFRLSQVSRALDLAVTSVTDALRHIESELASIRAAIPEDPNPSTSLQALDELSDRAEQLASSHISGLESSLTSIHLMLSQLDHEPNTSHPSLLGPRQKAVEDIDSRCSTCKSALESTMKRLAEARSAQEAQIYQRKQEEARLAAEAAAAEQRRVEEEARLAREAELRRIEEEARAAREAEQRRIEEEARLAKEVEQHRLEEARLAREAEERRVEEARLLREAEQRRVEEEVRLAKVEEQRKMEEDARLAKEVEQHRLEEEARLVREAEQRRLEEARLAMEAEQYRLEKEARLANQAEQEKARLEAEVTATVAERQLEAEALVTSESAAETRRLQDDDKGVAEEAGRVADATAAEQFQPKGSVTHHPQRTVDSPRHGSPPRFVDASRSRVDDDGIILRVDESTELQRAVTLTTAMQELELSDHLSEKLRPFDLETVPETSADPSNSAAAVTLQPAWEPGPQDMFSVRPRTMHPSDDSSTGIKSAIFKLRKRLRSIGINELARPSAQTHALPTKAQQSNVEIQLLQVVQDTEQLPNSVDDDSVVDTELRSLRSEVEASHALLQRIQSLTAFSATVEECDNALSDLLEHIDSFPSLPAGPLAASHTSNSAHSPELQLTTRLAFTERLIDGLKSGFSSVTDDIRASSEHERILQTWKVVADTWKDQSGKYWIGSQDPRLCFCRILRSQTVMVRVGGGWAELSKFIKDHFADAFRLLPESPPRLGSREEKWINSSTLSQASAQIPEPPQLVSRIKQLWYAAYRVDDCELILTKYTQHKDDMFPYLLRLCPACETSLTEPDDVVVCSLHPTNDYKTSVLSGLNPALVLEICSRSFQQTVARNLGEKNGYLQKELDSAVREARGQISLLNNKVSEMERDLDLERRKSTTLQNSLREREKEYQKLKVQFDKIKRKALLAPGGPNELLHAQGGPPMDTHMRENQAFKASHNVPVDVGAVVGDMNANGIQRTPIANRVMQPTNRVGRLPAHNQARQSNHVPRNQSFDRSQYTISDQSEEDVDHMLAGKGSQGRRAAHLPNNWNSNSMQRHSSMGDRQNGFAAPASRSSYSKFKPAR
ncbi:hypothetical protein EIP91_003263 [Steccherinum ochraceum]|uniref:GAR domain-containing protein n=1 Tax=Steccherinum ochraceum TaxID=92696 RepID=A0A4R0RTE8_9APHY|nr:hypothetical protein EIP91_003263 [Steccherinum ochraceum]